MQRLVPLRFKPIYRDYAWGGSRICEKFGRAAAPFSCGESWEIADRLDGMSIVSVGKFAGVSLNDLVVLYGEKLLGLGRKERRFPLLIKLIDAKEPLSLQVHPSEESAERFGGEPKNMAWYFLEGGILHAGFKRPSTEEALQEEKALDLLQKIEAKSGDTLFVPGGRIYAIGAGCMMLEVEQNSDSNYQAFDIDEAVRHLKFDDTASPIAKPFCVEENDTIRRSTLLSSLFFSIEKIELATLSRFECDPETFQIFFDVEAGESILLPADSEPLDLDPGIFIKIIKLS